MSLVEIFAVILDAFSSIFIFELHATVKVFLHIIQVLAIVCGDGSKDMKTHFYQIYGVLPFSFMEILPNLE